MTGATVTLLAVDLADAERRWRRETLAERVAAVPGGRLATAARLAPVAAAARRGKLAQVAAALPALDARGLFEALLEDLATAAIHDAPFSTLADLCDRLARTAKLRALELAALEAAPLAYPAELRAEPRPDTADGRAAFVVWLDGARLRLDEARAAAEALAQKAGDDLAEALAAVLAGPAVVGQVLP